MRDEVEAAVATLREAVASLTKRLNPAIAGETREKHERLRHSVDELDRVGIPVPESLRDLLNQLAEEIDQMHESRAVLVYIREQLVEISDQVNAALSDGDARDGRLRSPSEPPRGFLLAGQEVATRKWIDILRELMRLLAARHPDTFDRVLEVRGRTRQHFSRDPNDLVRPELIPGTSIFFDAQKGPAQIEAICREVIGVLGYRAGEFEILVSS